MRFLETIGSRWGRPIVPRGLRVYAVGDVHGRVDLLDQLLGLIDQDWRANPTRRRVLVFLGDLIDRGPDSRLVIDRLSNLAVERGTAVYLAGNHEEVLLRILSGEFGHLANWLRFGGRECLASYGLDADAIAAMEARSALEKIRRAIPAAHHEFLQSMADTLRIGDYLFVHAGVRPGIPTEAQSQTDLRWIRGDFLDSEIDHGYVVVHGHTITPTVDWRTNRIGIDTGAYQTGRLTGLVLEGRERRVIQTGKTA